MVASALVEKGARKDSYMRQIEVLIAHWCALYMKAFEITSAIIWNLMHNLEIAHEFRSQKLQRSSSRRLRIVIVIGVF